MMKKMPPLYYAACIIALLAACKATNKEKIQGMPDFTTNALVVLDNSLGKTPAAVKITEGKKIVAQVTVPAGMKKNILLNLNDEFQIEKDGSPAAGQMRVNEDTIVTLSPQIAWNTARALNQPAQRPPASTPTPQVVRQPPTPAPTPQAPQRAPVSPASQEPARRPPTSVPTPQVVRQPPAPVPQQPPAPVSQQQSASVPPVQPPPMVKKISPRFVLFDEQLGVPIAFAFVSCAVVPRLGNEVDLPLAQYNEFQNSLGTGRITRPERTGVDGSFLIENIDENSNVVFAFRGRNRGFVQYTVASLNSPQVSFSRFPADSPLRRAFEVRMIIGNEYLEEDSLSVVLRYRINHGINHNITTSFIEYTVPQESIHLTGGSNKGYIEFSPQDIGVSLFSSIEYVLQVKGVLKSGLEITAKNRTSIFKELWEIGEGELILVVDTEF
jgi:hypothetical protein